MLACFRRRGRLRTPSNELKWWTPWWRPYIPFWCCWARKKSSRQVYPLVWAKKETFTYWLPVVIQSGWWNDLVSSCWRRWRRSWRSHCAQKEPEDEVSGPQCCCRHPSRTHHHQLCDTMTKHGKFTQHRGASEVPFRCLYTGCLMQPRGGINAFTQQLYTVMLVAEVGLSWHHLVWLLCGTVS